jgi:hypothetical protein
MLAAEVSDHECLQRQHGAVDPGRPLSRKDRVFAAKREQIEVERVRLAVALALG